LRAYFLTSEASVVAIHGLLLSDLLTDLLQFEPDGQYGGTSRPEMLAGKVAFLAAQGAFEKHRHTASRRTMSRIMAM
jgi:hypothetical protein